MKQSPIYKFLKEIIYGGLDGIVTTFAVIAGFTGAQNSQVLQISISAVLLFGFANLFADATSMGLGNFLSERSNNIKEKTKLKNAKLTSLATFISFIVFGLIPLLPYLFIKTANVYTLFILACVFTIFALILLATVRRFVTKENWFKCVGEVLLIGCSAATVAFLVGLVFKG